MELESLLVGPTGEKFLQGIKQIAKSKPEKKQLLKVAEELGELQLAILQKINKGKTYSDIKEELVDVFMQINQLALGFDANEIYTIFSQKVDKMYVNQSKYLKETNVGLKTRLQ